MLAKKIRAIFTFLFALGLFGSLYWHYHPSLKLKNDILMKMTFSPKRITTEEALTIKINLNHFDGSPINNAKVKLEASMNHAGMIPILIDATNTKENIYEATINLTMKGGWIVFIIIKLDDQQEIKKTVQFATE